MSKRSERRAAERAAHKAARANAANTQNPTVAAKPVAASQPEAAEKVFAAAAAATESYSFSFDANDEESTIPNPTMPKSQPSDAQINANRQNAQHSTGAKTPEGKATVSQNRRAHGLLGRFMLHPSEDPAEYEDLVQSVYSDYNPESETEFRLAHSLIQHYWLTQRAIRLQEELTHQSEVDAKKLSLFMRYQATHERSYYKAQKELDRLRKEKRKEQIGFESQNRKQEAHDARVRLAHAKAENLEIDAACRKVMEVPIPGNTTIGFEELAHACSIAIASLVAKKRMEEAS